MFYYSFFFNDTATTEIYTLSLHDALPISAPVRPRLRPRAPRRVSESRWRAGVGPAWEFRQPVVCPRDRKSTRLNSSHQIISYAVFCLKKKKKKLDLHHLYIVIHTHESHSV